MFNPRSQPAKINKAFTLIEVLVGAFLVLIVFLGIFGVYQMGLKVVSQSKNKIIATAIANQQIENIRNLPYFSVGVKGSFPPGVLEAATSTWHNGKEYIIKNRVDYVVDATDGIALPEDSCPNDYKKVEVEVSWSDRFPGKVKFSTDVAPQNLIQECENEGGIISVFVFDAYGNMVISPLIEIKDPSTDQTLKSAMPLEGEYFFSLSTSTYKVVVSKENYSSDRTYGVNEVATPEKPHPLIIEGRLTETSFSIDKLSSFSISTLSPWGSDSFPDSFLDESKIGESSNLFIGEGKVNLASTSDGYLPSGYLVSKEISPADIIYWHELSFDDLEPFDSEILYQIYYASGTEWYLIPDSDLTGNSSGFSLSPINLSALSIDTYPQLKLKGNFSSNATSTTPSLFYWEVSWKNSEATLIPNVTFNLRGSKLIGLDGQENPVYKYSQDQVSDSQGQKTISNLEWDSYSFSIEPSSGLDLTVIDPSPQPIDLPPDTVESVSLYFKAENSLLVTVKDVNILTPIFSADVGLINNGLNYDTVQYTNEKGQTYFIPLTAAVYNLEIQAPGYLSGSTTVSVSGDAAKTIWLEQVE